MRTLGIDLASRDDRTGVCVLRWAERVGIEALSVGAGDAALLELAAGADAVGIDAPFGWPEAFVSWVAGERPRQAWTTGLRDRLRFRRTDAWVKERTGRWPLSVSSDLIAVPAMRCALLLDRLGVTDRSGDGRVFETYPAASLACFDLPARGYKGRRGRERRRALVKALVARTPWIEWTRRQRERCVAEDDALDALVAALVAGAAHRGLTERPSPEDRAAARREGWIHLPRVRLPELAPA
ncbi:MAG TPA: DUF429 domain-containing protein [Sandaracinaceae bacterium LLY-WYZ-13_1]|nr:DUF429 domain-containing protein [Sandaracinaceae bacterium LLY-WYZ-13_1]